MVELSPDITGGKGKILEITFIVLHNLDHIKKSYRSGCGVTHLEERQRKVDLSLWPAWAIEKAPGQSRTHVDIVRQHLKKKKRKEGRKEEIVILTIPKNLKDENAFFKKQCNILCIIRLSEHCDTPAL